MPAKREAEHATVETSVAACATIGVKRARIGRRSAWRRSTRYPGTEMFGDDGRAGMAAAGRVNRRGSGNAALWAGRGHARPTAGPSGLGGPGARAQRPGVAMTILWKEYREGPFSRVTARARFCDLLRRFRTAADPRDAGQHQSRGEGVFVEYSASGSGSPILTTERSARRRLRGVLGKAQPHLCRGDIDHALPGDRAAADVPLLRRRAEAAGPDNLKSGVDKASFSRTRDQSPAARWRRIIRSATPPTRPGRPGTRRRSRPMSNVHSQPTLWPSAADVLRPRPMK